MTDLLIRVRENNRRIVRGFSFNDKLGRYSAQILEGETIKPVLDLSHWLGTETISSATAAYEGGTVTLSTASTQITLTVSGVSSFCDAEITITTSGGRIRIEKFRFSEPNCTGKDDYGSYVGA